MNKSMRVVIYKMPLIERAMGGVSAVGLTIIPIACLCLGYDKKFEMIALLIAMLLYSFLMYLNIFKTYICLDLDNEKLIIRNGFKKDESTTTNLIDLQVEEDREYSGLFSLNINFVGYTKKILVGHQDLGLECCLVLFAVKEKDWRSFVRNATDI